MVEEPQKIGVATATKTQVSTRTKVIVGVAVVGMALAAGFVPPLLRKATKSRCAPDQWRCSEWAACDASGLQTRTCQPNHRSCARVDGPPTQQVCAPPVADAAAPLITMVTLPTNNLTSGIVAAARLAASAGTSADAKLKELAFTVDKSLGIVLASTGDSSIRRVGDAANFQGTAILSACDDQSARCVVVITLTNEQVIAAGTTQVFDFRLMVSGSVIAGSYLTTSMDRPSVLTSGWTLIK